MKALTLRQPWASLVANGVKTIETRSWATKHRGRIAIHAGKGGRGYFYCQTVDNVLARNPVVKKRELHMPDGAMIPDPGITTWPVGAVVALATLVDCVPIVENGWPVNEDWRSALVIEDDTLTLYRTDDPEVSEVADDQIPFGDFAPGRWAWILDCIEQLPNPIPARGHQRLWNWKLDSIEATS